MRYIDVKDLTFYYDDEPVLEDISYFVEDGEFVILTGENGAAKSTLIKATLGLLKPSKGAVTLATKNAAGEKFSRLLPLTSGSPAPFWNWSNRAATQEIAGSSA